MFIPLHQLPEIKSSWQLCQHYVEIPSICLTTGGMSLRKTGVQRPETTKPSTFSRKQTWRMCCVYASKRKKAHSNKEIKRSSHFYLIFLTSNFTVGVNRKPFDRSTFGNGNANGKTNGALHTCNTHVHWYTTELWLEILWLSLRCHSVCKITSAQKLYIFKTGLFISKATYERNLWESFVELWERHDATKQHFKNVTLRYVLCEKLIVVQGFKK